MHLYASDKPSPTPYYSPREAQCFECGATYLRQSATVVTCSAECRKARKVRSAKREAARLRELRRKARNVE